MDPRLLTAVQTCLDSSPQFPRSDTTAFARLREDDLVELLVPDVLDGREGTSFLVNVRTSDTHEPTHAGVGIPPPPEMGFVDVTILVRRVEDMGFD